VLIARPRFWHRWWVCLQANEGAVLGAAFSPLRGLAKSRLAAAPIVGSGRVPIRVLLPTKRAPPAAERHGRARITDSFILRRRRYEG
jgi:hypothetical protein